MNCKFIIYNEDGDVISYGESNTPIENIVNSLGSIVEVENFDELIEAVPATDE